MGLCVLEGQGYKDGYDAGIMEGVTEGRANAAYAFGGWTTPRSVYVKLPAGQYKYCIVMGTQSNSQNSYIRNEDTGQMYASIHGDQSTNWQNHTSGRFTLDTEATLLLQANCYNGYTLVTVIPEEGKT